MRYDVIVIGGGISGLTTCIACVQHGQRVLLIERNSRLGGRLLTVQRGNIKYEAGAGRVSTNHTRTLALLQAFHMHVAPIPTRREYRSQDKGFKPTRSPTHALLRKVFEAATKVPEHTLRNLSFGYFCTSILGSNAASQLVQSFGYNAEFEMMNAWDGLEMFRRDFGNRTQYVTCVEGFSELIRRMVSYLLNTGLVTIVTEHTAVGWKQHHNHMSVHCKTSEQKDRRYYGRAIVCSIPKDDLHVFTWSKQQHAWLSSVSAVPLHRIYGRFPVSQGNTWFSQIPITTTTNPIRQFIPIQPQKGLTMISYSDAMYAQQWHQQQNLQAELLNQLHVVFPEVGKIPPPLWVESHYWPAGVHMWKPGVHSQQVHDKLLQPYGKNVPWFLIGESYSLHQAWIEGCLETVEEILPILFQFCSHKVGGKQMHKDELIRAFQKKFPHVKEWVYLEDNGYGRILDVSQWKLYHPGGTQNILDHIGQDITSIMAQSMHYGKHNVQQMIQKYTIFSAPLAPSRLQ